MKIAPRKRTPAQQGFTLIEALIAFVILSVGLLGIVSLQGLSKTSQHHAIQRTRAVTLADTLVERIRINPAGMATYNIGLNPVAVDPNAAEPAPNCRDAICDPNELAIHDMWAWGQALAGAMVRADGASAGGLRDPRGCVQFNAANGMARTGQLSVIVQWTGLQDATDSVPTGGDVCGGDAAGTDPLRRQVVINTFVIDETEL